MSRQFRRGGPAEAGRRQGFDIRRPTPRRRWFAPTGGSGSIALRDKALIAVVAAALVGGVSFATYWRAGRIVAAQDGLEPAALYAGLPADAAQANVTFRARVLSGFPLLTPADLLTGTLARQGFKSDGWFGHRMTFRRQNGVSRGCDFTASVTWEADDRARISALDARFLRTPGCVDGFW